MDPENLTRPPKRWDLRDFDRQCGPDLSAGQDIGMPWITLLLHLVNALVTERLQQRVDRLLMDLRRFASTDGLLVTGSM